MDKEVKVGKRRSGWMSLRRWTTQKRKEGVEEEERTTTYTQHMVPVCDEELKR